PSADGRYAFCAVEVKPFMTCPVNVPSVIAGPFHWKYRPMQEIPVFRMLGIPVRSERKRHDFSPFASFANQ
ncbi:hypothetical protein, partial [Pseudomonas syringae group genomosp. 3]|uniref:hypothetical protein n=1 Tax=Pseudomonas syringae group genomosp. 3 TaxID=251701 RepID=UPI001C814976